MVKGIGIQTKCGGETTFMESGQLKNLMEKYMKHKRLVSQIPPSQLLASPSPLISADILNPLCLPPPSRPL